MNHPIENIMNTSMEHIKALADVNTVIGNPIMTEDDAMILPVSKVALGMLVGGGEYAAEQCGRRNAAEEDNKYPFIGASTLGMSLTPLAFLAVQNGTVRVLPAKQDCASDRLIELIPHIMETAERLIHELSDDGSRYSHRYCSAKKQYEAKPSEEKKEAAYKYDIEYEPSEGSEA